MTEGRLVYADSSALVKLVISEPESEALIAHLVGAQLTTSRIALVEVSRATAISDSSSETQADTDTLLTSCLLIAMSDSLLRAAGRLASREVRALDAIHLASALHVEPDEFVVYDRRLARAAQARGLAVVSPGAAG